MMTTIARDRPLHVLMITSEWPTPTNPISGIFIFSSVGSLSRAGVNVEVFHFRGGKRPQNYLRAWQKVRAKLKQQPFDLLHAQFGQSGLLALPKSLPLVVTFRGSDLEGIVGSQGRYTAAGRFLRMASKIVANAADEVITVSEKLARHLPKRSFHVIPSGINLDLFKPIPSEVARAQLGLPTHRHLVLFAADPQNPVKRYRLVQAAMERLGGEPPAELVVSNGVPHDMMPLYLNACDVLLLTSLHEGSPNVVKEALACNMPVVSTDVGDVRTRIGGIDGCAITSDSPDDIAAALQLVLRQQKRVDGRSTVKALDERLLTDEIIQVYELALAKWQHKRGRRHGGSYC
jgi:glycosyltransferase involved in cell wall biosynthesis